MTDTPPPARIQAAAAALEAVDRAQQQWLVCAMDRLHAEQYEGRYSGAMMVHLRDAEDEARAQVAAAQAQATAALAAVREAVSLATEERIAQTDHRDAWPALDRAAWAAGMKQTEQETAAALGCVHPDDEGER